WRSAPCPAGAASSEESVHPTTPVRPAAPLDAGELLAQPCCHRSGPAVTDGLVEAGTGEPADRGDHRSGAAGEDLRHATGAQAVEHLSQRNRTFGHRTSLLTAQLEHRTS